VSGSPAPDGQGQCSARQLTLGTLTRSTGASTLGTTALYFREPVRNTGAACTLRWNGKISVAPAGKRFTTVRAENAGTGESAVLPADGSRFIVLGAWWPIAGTTSSRSAKTWCADQVAGVSRVKVLVAAGGIVIGLGTQLPAVCPDPPSMSLAIQA
jgi:hypothetical protein